MDDEGQIVKQPELKFRNLEALSVNALNAYIVELEEEIKRAQTEIGKRGNARATAEAFFS